MSPPNSDTNPKTPSTTHDTDHFSRHGLPLADRPCFDRVGCSSNYDQRRRQRHATRASNAVVIGGLPAPAHVLLAHHVTLRTSIIAVEPRFTVSMQSCRRSTFRSYSPSACLGARRVLARLTRRLSNGPSASAADHQHV